MLGIFDNSGIELPHKPLSQRVQLIVENAISSAWIHLSINPASKDAFGKADEDSITRMLHDQMFNHIYDKDVVDGFNGEIFATMIREPKISNFDGSSPDKMPDIVIQFVDRPQNGINTQHGLFIECKPVDSVHTVGVHYCDKGLIRFVNGDYAWAMQSAMMIAYCRDGYTVSSKLVGALGKRPSEQSPIRTISGPAPCPLSQKSSASEQVYVSVHERSFCYVETGEPAPPITIRHLWLMRPTFVSAP